MANMDFDYGRGLTLGPQPGRSVLQKIIDAVTGRYSNPGSSLPREGGVAPGIVPQNMGSVGDLERFIQENLDAQVGRPGYTANVPEMSQRQPYDPGEEEPQVSQVPADDEGGAVVPASVVSIEQRDTPPLRLPISQMAPAAAEEGEQEDEVAEGPAEGGGPPIPRARPDGGGVRKVTINRGDTLWDIAEREYGDPMMYRYLAAANRIQNPDRVLAGQVITIPPMPTPRARPRG